MEVFFFLTFFYLGIVDFGAPRLTQVDRSPPATAGHTRDEDLSLVSSRSPGGGNGNLLQYSCLENPMDRGAWWNIGLQSTILQS